VPDYDAFGREIDEDPVARLREPEPVLEPPAPARPQFVRPPRGSHRGLAALLLLLAVVGAIAWSASVVVTKVQDGIDGVIGEPDTRPPTGLQRDSLVRRANFADALATLRESGLGRPISLRVAPDRVDAALVGEGGRTHQVQVDRMGKLRELSSSPAPGSPTTAFSRIDPAAPERLARTGAARAGVRARRIDYLVLNAGKPLTWGAYFKGGKVVIGNAHGRPQRVL
jgi:hypothetical protein